MAQGKNIEAEEILAMIKERTKITPTLKLKWWFRDNKWQIISASLLLGTACIIFGLSTTLFFLFFAALFCIGCVAGLIFFMSPFIFLQLIIDDIGRSIARYIK